MKLSVRDLLELAGLALIVAVVWLATGLAWATVLVVAVALLYLSHAWVWDEDGRPTSALVVDRKPPAPPLPPHPPGTDPIVSTRRAL